MMVELSLDGCGLPSMGRLKFAAHAATAANVSKTLWPNMRSKCLAVSSKTPFYNVVGYRIRLAETDGPMTKRRCQRKPTEGFPTNGKVGRQQQQYKES
jgi:hypothetical protein